MRILRPMDFLAGMDCGASNRLGDSGSSVILGAWDSPGHCGNAQLRQHAERTCDRPRLNHPTRKLSCRQGWAEIETLVLVAADIFQELQLRAFLDPFCHHLEVQA